MAETAPITLNVSVQSDGLQAQCVSAGTVVSTTMLGCWSWCATSAACLLPSGWCQHMLESNPSSPLRPRPCRTERIKQIRGPHLFVALGGAHGRNVMCAQCVCLLLQYLL